MGIGIAGALQGISGAMVREHEENLARDMAGRQAAMTGWTRILDDPNATPEHKKYALSAIMGIATTPAGKQWSKFTKPYEPPPPQPQQAQQQTPSMTLAPQPSANPGPQAPIAAGGGASPGVLQGGANQLPPLTPVPSAVPPPPSPIGMAGAPPPAPVTIPGSTTTVTGPPPPPDAYAAAGYFHPGAVQAQTIAAQKQAIYDVAVRNGATPEQARIAAGLVPFSAAMQPHRVSVMLQDGKTTAAVASVGPDMLPHYFDLQGNDITPSVQREVGLAVIPKTKVNVNEGTVTRANGEVVPISSPDLTPDEKQAVSDALGVKFPTTQTSKGTTPTIGGGSVTTSTSKKTPGNVSAPPNPAAGTGSTTGQPSQPSQPGKSTTRTAPTVARSFAADTGDPQVDYTTWQVAADPKNWQMLVGSDKALAQKVRSNLSRLGIDITQPDASVRRMQGIATALLPKIDTVEKELNDPALAAKLGAFSSRWEDWKRGKLGSGADPAYVKLFNDIEFLQSGTMIAHSGRTPIALLDKFSNMLNAGRMDAATLKASLGSFKDTLQHYQDLIPTGSEKKAEVMGQAGQGKTQPPPPPSAGGFTVSVGGRTFSFPTQKAADDFKREAGVQ